MIDIQPYNPSHHSRVKGIFAQSMLGTFYQNQLKHIWGSNKLILCQIFIFVAVSLTSGSPFLALGSVVIYCMACRTEHWTTATYFRFVTTNFYHPERCKQKHHSLTYDGCPSRIGKLCKVNQLRTVRTTSPFIRAVKLF